MILFKTIVTLKAHILELKQQGKHIGFCPTMGALHDGHLSLVRAAQAKGLVTFVSIFVNPTQFNNPSDFEKYPITLEKDCGLLMQVETDVLFLPSVLEMYPNGMECKKKYELGALENKLDGLHRPGHFQGVCQVVERLLEIVQPDELFLGQKDLQQCLILKRLVEILGLKILVNIVPTLREKNGLAMSSRNMRLTDVQRSEAGIIYQQLIFLKKNLRKTSLADLKQKATESLLGNGFNKVDYVDIVDADTLESIAYLQPNQKAVAIVAVFLGEVRLIDNMFL